MHESERAHEPSPTLSPTDPVPRGLLTLCPAPSVYIYIHMYVCIYVYIYKYECVCVCVCVHALMM